MLFLSDKILLYLRKQYLECFELMKRVIILAIVVIFIIIVAIVLMRGFDNGGGSITLTPFSGDNSIASKYAIKDTPKFSPVGKVYVDGVIPFFIEEPSEDNNARALTDLPFAEELNNELLGLYNNYYNEIILFKDGVSYDDDKNDIIKNKMYRFNTNYNRYNNGSIISLVINLDYNTSGLRSNAWKEIFNIDVEKCKQLDLSDLFSSSAYKDRIISEINNQAKSKGFKLIEAEGITNIPDNQKFYIKDKKLVLYFENSAISKSEIEFVMPFEFNESLNKFSL